MQIPVDPFLLDPILATCNAMRNLQENPEPLGHFFEVHPIPGVGCSVMLVIPQFKIRKDITDWNKV